MDKENIRRQRTPRVRQEVCEPHGNTAQLRPWRRLQLNLGRKPCFLEGVTMGQHPIARAGHALIPDRPHHQAAGLPPSHRGRPPRRPGLQVWMIVVHAFYFNHGFRRRRRPQIIVSSTASRSFLW